MKRQLLLWVAVFCGGLCPALAGDWYVATNGAGAPGTNWSTAFKMPQAGLDAARTGDTVCVAGHTFGLTQPIEWNNPAPGVTVRGGYSATNDMPLPGPRNTSRWPTVFRIVPTNQPVMMMTSVRTGTLDSIVFTGVRYGLGVARQGGGVSAISCLGLTMISCVVTDNWIESSTWGVASYGGGIFTDGTTLTMTNCVIAYNRVRLAGYNWAYGAGIYGQGGWIRLSGCEITGNWLTSGNGAQGSAIGATCPVEMRNCLVRGNTADGGGGYAAVHLGAGGLVANSTIAGNVAIYGLYRGGGSVAVTNSVLWNNGDDVYGPVTLAWSDVEDGDSNGVNGCIKSDPLFEYGYYLPTNSPCVNAGTNTPAYYGLAGRTTRADGTVDSGRVDLGYHYPTGALTAGYCKDLYVSPAGNDGASGTNWAGALRTVGKALSRVRDGTRVHVASGQYTNGLESFPLKLERKCGVQLLGTNFETTVISTMGSSNVHALEMNELTGKTRVSGISVTGARIAPPAQMTSTRGGGIYAINCSDVTLSSCAVTNNWLEGNSWNSVGYGGGIYANNVVMALTNCVVSANRARIAGYNWAYGAGIYAEGSGKIDLFGCEMVGNWLTCGNSAPGAAIYALCAANMLDCLVRGNTADGGGGHSALYLSAGGAIVNCTVADNVTTYGVNRAGGTVTVTNSIIWNNGDDVYGTVTLGYSDVEDGDNNGTNKCIMGNPLFEYGYYLGAGSPCVNTGTNTPAHYGLLGRTTRADGVADSGVVDMGYHYPTGILTAGYYTDLYVSLSGNDSNSGTNWTQALRTIGKALSMVQDGTKVHVAAGQYTNKMESFPLKLSGKNGVQVLGTNCETTVISATGTNNVRVMEFSGLTGRTIVQGVTFTGARHAPAPSTVRLGGGVYAVNCGDLVFSRCAVIDNWIEASAWSGTARGGGVYADNTGLTMTNCVVALNRARMPGYAWSYGAGVYGQGAGTINLYGCVIENNWLATDASGQGSGIYASCPAEMRNCLVKGNTAGGLGHSAVYLGNGGLLANCTIAGNAATNGVTRAGGTVQVINSILWNNGDDVNGPMSLLYSDIEDGDSNGICGCISAYPVFTDEVNGNYRIPGPSPCRNTGTNLSWMATGVDLDGNPRIHAFHVDMGAYESLWDRGTFLIIR